MRHLWNWLLIFDFSIVCAYMQLESFEDYKNFVYAELNLIWGKQRYIDSLCIIKEIYRKF